ncbi:MAG: PHA/PHB synthase family protein [Alphaproteobacteria bacterium]
MNEDSTPHIPLSVKNPEAMARNISRFMEQVGHALAAYLKPREEGTVPPIELDGQLAEMIKTLTTVYEYWTRDPARAMQAQSYLYAGYLSLWTTSLARMLGEAVPPAVAPAATDKRFRDEEWDSNQLFNFLKQAYLITSRWAETLVEQADGLDEHTRHKAAFYVRQIASALSPTNFVLTNPELLRETLNTDAENLVRGMEMLAQDIKAGKGKLKIRQSETAPFKLGSNLATTPGKVVHQNDLCQLIQYEPATKTVSKRPLLMLPPWINKFYILDLNPQKSFVKWCVDQGHTVFVISWVNPGPQQAKKDFSHYMREGVLEALDVITDITGATAIDTAGYCVGGTLLSVTLAFAAATGDQRIKSATLFATQVDFTHAGDLKVFVDESQISKLEKQMSVRGYLEGHNMSAAFNMLRPDDLIWPYVISNYLMGKQPSAFDLLFWNADTTRMPAANHAFYLRNCYLENRLAKGEMEIDGVLLDLKKVTIPIYNLATRDDHIAPPRSVAYASSFFGGKVTFVVAGSGHIAGVINPPARHKYQYWTGRRPRGDSYEQWQARATEHDGSWWPHWHAWTKAMAKGQRSPPPMGSKSHPPIEDAPGSYVRSKA